MRSIIVRPNGPTGYRVIVHSSSGGHIGIDTYMFPDRASACLFAEENRIKHNDTMDCRLTIEGPQ